MEIMHFENLKYIPTLTGCGMRKHLEPKKTFWIDQCFALT